LQQHWGDVHQRFILYSCDALENHLPDGLISRIEERVFVEDFGTRIPITPDARVVEWRPRSRSVAAEEAEAGVAVVVESREFIFDEEETTEGYIEIREADGSKVVTSLSSTVPPTRPAAREPKSTAKNRPK
jgi:hypothetical protein